MKMPHRFSDAYNRECTKAGSDKNSLQHTFAGVNYMDHYAQLIGTVDNFRGKRNPKILEIGVLKGASLRMWQSLFPKAIVIGLDIDPQIESTDKFTIIKGRQNDITVLNQLNTVYGPFDFIIDDGSHDFRDVLVSANYFIPRMKAEGLYVIEDTNVSWPKPSWPGMENSLVPVNDAHELYRFVSNVMMGVQMRSGPVRAVHSFHGMIAFDIADENWKPLQA